MTRKIIVAFLCLTLVSIVGACGNGGSVDQGTMESQAQSELSAEELGEIGAKIYRNPDNSETILDEHGLTQEQFDRGIERVTSDPALSKSYRKSFESNI